MFSFASDQKTEIPITSVYQERFTFRYGYARAGETQQADDIGQDYLAFHTEEKSFQFVLCDGVSLSFCGNIAARFLATKLLVWLRSVSVEEARDEHAMAAALDAHLTQWVDEATEMVNAYRLPRALSPLLRDVLEEKRINGSEAMFVCGRVDIIDDWSKQANVFLACSGDLRVRLWEGTQEIFCLPYDKGDQYQRWSTKKGLLSGSIKTASSIGMGQPFNRMLVYSDGFAEIDSLRSIPRTERLQNLMTESFSSPTSDDISFLDIAW